MRLQTPNSLLPQPSLPLGAAKSARPRINGHHKRSQRRSLSSSPISHDTPSKPRFSRKPTPKPAALRPKPPHLRPQPIPAALQRPVREPVNPFKDLPKRPPASIAIIGGGITGLSAAIQAYTDLDKNVHLTPPHVTLYESSDRLGGWCDTTRVPVEGGHIRLERGPRTLAVGPKAARTLDVADRVGVLNSVRWVRKEDAGARNRYVYLDGEGVYRVPTGGIMDALNDVLNGGTRRSLIRDVFSYAWPNRNNLVVMPDEAESLGTYLEQFFGPKVVNDFASAFVHGIYAGDVYELSALCPGPWERLVKFTYAAGNAVGKQSTIKTVLAALMFLKAPEDVYSIQAPMYWDKPWYKDALGGGSFVFYFKEGMQVLPLAMESWLNMYPKVDGQYPDIQKSTKVTKISKVQDGIEVTTTDAQGATSTNRHDYVICSLPPQQMQKIIEPSPPWTDMRTNTVATVTLFWANDYPINLEGFGYIIPRLNFSQNPHSALGVIFDSSTRPEQDTAPGQKVTVLLGGPYWISRVAKGRTLPTSDELIKHARESLATQLKTIIPEPTFAQADILDSCIPQPTTAFWNSVRSEESITWQKSWNRRLLLAAPPISGPGVHDGISAGAGAVRRIRIVESHEMIKNKPVMQEPWAQALHDHPWADNCWVRGDEALGYVPMQAVGVKFEFGRKGKENEE
ncbi:FAD/NAD(P)-binding domain-containing protein [Microthyrium microscopicum]|uniref:Protoporphyrinogen oxidase n=1 Tax=Microthyrium microscopicum TaxID=703497 RepID=A0A6A6U0F6_9PEZI|nr:FAD/NAD(P)-binding domain-containing protein [Microthyrium microscopicum]